MKDPAKEGKKKNRTWEWGPIIRGEANKGLNLELFIKIRASQFSDRKVYVGVQ